MEKTATTAETNQVSVISDIKNNLKRMFSKEYVRSARESWIYEIIIKILDAPGTLKFMPTGDTYYLSNENYNYYVKIGFQKIDIVCGNTTISEPCTSGFVCSVQEEIRKQVISDVNLIESKIDTQGEMILKRLDETVAK